MSPGSGALVVCPGMHVTSAPPSPPSPTLPRPGTGRPSLWVLPRCWLAGAFGGLVHGVAIRAWMRLISDDPEFSWNGTIFIVGAFTITFSLAGLVVGARRRGWRAGALPLRVIAVVGSLSCFLGAGGLMLPTIVFGALAVARVEWRRSVRWVFGSLSALATVPVLTQLGDHAAARTAFAGLVYLALVAVQIAVFAQPYRATVSHLPRPVRVAGGALALAVVVGVAVLAVGVRG